MTTLAALCVVAILAASAVVLRHRLARSRREGSDRAERDRAEAAADYVATFLVAMYTVLLAFIIVVQWQRSDDVGNDVRTEATDLTQLTWTAQRLSASDQAQVRSMVSQYTSTVLKSEWPPAPTAYADSSYVAITGLRTLFSTQMDLGDQTTMRDQELAVVEDLAAARQERLDKSLRTMPGALTLALIVLSAVTVLTPFLLGPRAEPLSILGVAVTAALVSAGLFLVLDLQAPYSGQFAVSRAPLLRVQHELSATSQPLP